MLPVHFDDDPFEPERADGYTDAGGQWGGWGE
jgi:hypothetical protein